MPEHLTLADLGAFEKDVYPVGRLDRDSEGLLILTNDKSLTNKLLDPKFGHKRTYWVQVDGIPDASDLQQLRAGVTIKLKKGKYQTRPAKAQLLGDVNLEERNPPVRFRKHIPTTWIALTLTEGKNRQVRKMCAQIGHPCLRLIRVAIEDLQLNDLKIGAVKTLPEKTIKRLLNL